MAGGRDETALALGEQGQGVVVIGVYVAVGTGEFVGVCVGVSEAVGVAVAGSGVAEGVTAMGSA
ncbi:MAG: hypothetical protein COW33_06620 [Anaerolineae bacterium CG17_big_fil_post_rev_8_21_14_2_50_57_27]|nr:MAG: hypothetical protein COW33_06620 [Anaerolineae bacterium CG17_big_fil_post_rev_8_21_14_2_50_57_27]